MRERTRELGLLIIGDVFCFIAALYITLAARYLALPSQELLRIHLIPFLIFTGLWILVFFISGLYDKQTRVARLHMMGRIVYAQFVNILIALVLFFVLPFGISPKTNLLIYLFVSIALISAWRTYLYPWLDGARRKRMSALLIASGTEAHELLHEINENNRFNYRIVHHIDPENSMRDVPGAPQLQKMISQKNIDLIIVNTSLLYAQHTLTLLYSDLAAQGLPPMRDFKTVYEETFDRVPLATVERDWITYHCADRDSLMYTVSKRLIDIVGSSILLLFFALLLPFIALAIKLDSKGPVFITQDRIGKNGRRLRVWKLRTMTQSESTSGLFFKENTTNVVTRVGKYLRASSLDEVPQCWNIILGDLSLIGPRSHILAQAERLAKIIPHYKLRTTVTPGITGWAQTHQFYEPGNISPQSNEETCLCFTYDLYYITHRSLMLDIEIALRTIKTVISRI
ncbi:hypothetical protein A3C89_01770 [Candidatus Kaiserbacteria bacterium RIFCSPHIGHO2_02_FULL_50_50]|uniref:Bacterial sugar transferase domain-containing protein n=1 Tax=Candidatus Kaiserbacteria bacterium RIFCSPHIGHO2_02_FULL_50_50 TaxID=1798492 RepID=A0A1F6DCJ8_9BACT|nr:MAG: hypothetical protein A3C89_01770 [Candidatus Kaiserbacteria bacterium RIFCSPHIGHO2_02_FULL_50_50]OGG88999.1 MAG: hypothetical protein A3G62_04170 [Candidatus Kaiserbacteria bacterium RIFCSPLOWO2_12_FULL_50_10]